MKKTVVTVYLGVCSLLHGQVTDPGCTRYPASERTELLNQLGLERQTAEFAKSAKRMTPKARAAIARAGFIDNEIFNKMDADGVSPAPLSSDAEFLRRVSIDLNGR